MGHQGFSDAIRQEIAYQNVDCKLDDRFEIGLSISESEMLVEEITQNAAEKIVGCRRKPVAKMKHIVEHKHNGCSKQCVDDSHQQEPVC